MVQHRLTISKRRSLIVHVSTRVLRSFIRYVTLFVRVVETSVGTLPIQRQEGRGKGTERKRERREKKGKKLQRNGTVRIQTDRIVSDRIAALPRERMEKDQNSRWISGESYRYSFNANTYVRT